MNQAVQRAQFHAKLRWVGVPLLLSGLSLLGFAVFRALVGGSGWTVAFSVFGAALSLASFGANHDATMAYAFEGRGDGLPPNLREELDEELERDRNGVVSARPTPKLGMAIPVVALCVQAWVAWRLFGGAG